MPRTGRVDSEGGNYHRPSATSAGHGLTRHNTLELIATGGCVALPGAGSTTPGTVARTGGISNGAKIAIAVVAVGGGAGAAVAASGGSKSR